MPPPALMVVIAARAALSAAIRFGEIVGGAVGSRMAPGMKLVDEKVEVLDQGENRCFA